MLKKDNNIQTGNINFEIINKISNCLNIKIELSNKNEIILNIPIEEIQFLILF